ncbi:MAG: AAA family ATPase [Pseudomonadota bacterium]
MTNRENGPWAEKGANSAKVFPGFAFGACRPVLNQRYLVKGLLHPNGISIIWGETGARKTFAVMDLSLAIASGAAQWNGRRLKQGRVLYICAEGGDDDARNRVAAVKQHRDIDEAQFAIIPTPVPVDMDPALEQLERTVGAIFDEPLVDLIIVDTLSACLGATDEYHNGEVARMLARLRGLARRLGGAHVSLVHHTGHSFNRERGAYAWRANADVSIEIAFDDKRNLGVVTAHKVRHGVTGTVGAFACEHVELGRDDDGDLVSTLVITECKTPAEIAYTGSVKLTPLQSEILEEIDIGLAEQGRRLKPAPEMPEVLALERSDLNERLRAAGIIGDENAQHDAPLTIAERSRLRDNLSALKVKGMIGRTSHHVWRIPKIDPSRREASGPNQL